MRASLARARASGTIGIVSSGDTSIVDEPLRRGSHRFTIRGHVEVDSARQLEQRLRDVVLGGKRTVVVDLTELTELTSSLVGALIRTQRSLDWRGGRLLVGCESAAIRRQLADLGDIFEFADARLHRR